nr:MAG TPA: hypothetical protein [Caudoviricetes sp.]DAZ01140.1 MAG TPA: hypothetical protein [Caudoviricetes sp.]
MKTACNQLFSRLFPTDQYLPRWPSASQRR